jgi:hypothetical protein
MMAYEDYGGYVDGMLSEIADTHMDLISHRRPEEVLVL